MKKLLVRNPRNSKCETMRLSGLKWSDWYVESKNDLYVKAEDGERYHQVTAKAIASNDNLFVGMRDGNLVWVIAEPKDDPVPSDRPTCAG